MKPLSTLACWIGLVAFSAAQEPNPNAPQGDESQYYSIQTYPVPEDIVLEVSGLTILPDGRPLVATRRGEVFVVDDAFTGKPEDARFTRWLEGLQECLGLLPDEDGWVYLTQRGELSRARDVDGDDRADELETVCDFWRISGNYHEYNFGPRLASDGSFWITTNKPFGAQPFGAVPWRGFGVRITREGEFVPECSGLRSPAGLEVSPFGEAFYTDNQGEWCGASKLSHLIPGTFHGHPHGIAGTDLPEWTHARPQDPPNRKLFPEVAADHPQLQLPACWFPYDEMGRSPAGFVWDATGGRFGPFEGQVFVVDQYAAIVMRVSLEEIDGHWQGACMPFLSGLACGAIRCTWAPDGTLLVGETERGWKSLGRQPFGLERIAWTGEMPFEILHVGARPDGFEVTFTQPAEPETVLALETWSAESYTYLLHSDYGSPEVDRAEPVVRGVTLSPDGLRARLFVDGLRAGYVHELRMPAVRSAGGTPLLHPRAYYTLVKIPER